MAFYFTDAPPQQLRNSLKWLRQMRAQLDDEIRVVQSQLESFDADNSARSAFNALARDLISKNLTAVEAENRLSQMGWQNEDIEGSQKVLTRLASLRRREMRDAEIVRRMLLKTDKAEALAAEFHLSRKQIYAIVAKANPLKRSPT